MVLTTDTPAEMHPAVEHQPSILVIDDEQVMLDLLSHWLTSAGFKTTPAQSGAAGIALFRSQPFALVLTDLAMPDGDGFQVLSTIVNENPELPVIIISGACDIHDSIKALRLGAWDYITKPTDHALLIHQVSQALERAALLKENTKHRINLQAAEERRTTELKQANLNLHQEITSRQQIENQLKEANDRWQTTFDSMSDFISIHAPDYTILKANKALAQFLGQRPEDIIGKKCYQIFHGSHSPWPTCPHCELLDNGQAHTCEIIDPRLGKPLLVTVSPLKREGKLIGSIHVAKDISRQKKLDEERQKNANLESIAVLCGGLAHDFNNLLTALNGYIDLAKREKKLEDVDHWLNNAKMVASLATELTRQLLTFSKGGAPVINCVPVAALIQDSLDHAQNSFPHVHPEVNITQDIWPIDGDHAQLRTVIQNIFYNAGEAMPGGGTLTIEAENVPKGTIPPLDHGPFESSPEGDLVHSPHAADSVLISFTDHGSGISPEILGKIFDPYFTTSAKGATKGKGLGLALCHSIISKHHGQISVSSKKDQGTTVSICLPASPAATPHKKTPEGKPVQPHLPRSSGSDQ